jgi:hypothetical protein
MAVRIEGKTRRGGWCRLAFSSAVNHPTPDPEDRLAPQL